MIQLLDKQFVRYITSEQLDEEISWMAQKINRDYKDKQPLFLAVLNGAFMFAADLYRQVKLDSAISFVKLASYEGTESTGEIKSLLGLAEEIKGRDVIILEDIVDTGRSMAHLMAQLREHEPASLALASLLVKPAALQEPVEISYRGFDIPNLFVVGYGLDYDGLGRNLPEIYQLHEANNL